MRHSVETHVQGDVMGTPERESFISIVFRSGSSAVRRDKSRRNAGSNFTRVGRSMYIGLEERSEVSINKPGLRPESPSFEITEIAYAK